MLCYRDCQHNLVLNDSIVVLLPVCCEPRLWSCSLCSRCLSLWAGELKEYVQFTSLFSPRLLLWSTKSPDAQVNMQSRLVFTILWYSGISQQSTVKNMYRRVGQFSTKDLFILTCYSWNGFSLCHLCMNYRSSNELSSLSNISNILENCWGRWNTPL